MVKEFLDFGQIARVLDEIVSPINKEDNALNNWADLDDVLTEIKANDTLTEQLKLVLEWINNNPRHTYPKRVKGWLNTISTQFSKINSRKILHQMIRLKILHIHTYKNPGTPAILPQDRIYINHKRCHLEIDNDEEDYDCKRYKNNDMVI